MSFSAEDIQFMQRALQLARNGRGHVSPNPMVGAVIVHEGRIIGEGWHRRFGGPHAEVNAVRSVAPDDLALLPAATMYVSLEPCSHYGKTPPCAKLLVDIGISKVIVASLDPNPKVSGRGIRMLREAGTQVETGLLEKEALELNKAFMKAHSLRRPFVTLKWACSADGFMDAERSDDGKAARFSNTLSSQKVHWRRAAHDAIAVGARTAIMDNPQLTVRSVDGRNPRPIVFDRRDIVTTETCRLLLREDAIHVCGAEAADLALVLHKLYSEYNITSVLVEGGAGLLNTFISEDLWDEAYVEIAPFELGERGSTKSPVVPEQPSATECFGDNIILTYINRL